MFDVLQNTYSQLQNHGQDGFETLCRLVYKSIYGIDPETKIKPSEMLGLCESDIKSTEEERSVAELWLLKESMPFKHYRIKDDLQGKEEPIIVVNLHGNDRLIDGSNRINYWFSQGDLEKLLKINHHILDYK